MPETPANSKRRLILAQARSTALESLALASQALANVHALLQEIDQQEADIAREQASQQVRGGVDQPGLAPIRKDEFGFEVYRHDIKRWTGGIPVLGSPRAAKAWIDVLNEQHASKQWLRN